MPDAAQTTRLSPFEVYTISACLIIGTFVIGIHPFFTLAAIYTLSPLDRSNVRRVAPRFVLKYLQWVSLSLIYQYWFHRDTLDMQCSDMPLKWVCIAEKAAKKAFMY